MSSPLRDAAAVYHFELALSVIPVADKRPRVRWKNAPPWDDFEHLFDAPETTGVAVVLGKPSSDLVVRDFDKPQAFERWETRVPRSRQSVADSAYRPRRRRIPRLRHNARRPLVKLSDGELRGNGAIVVMPPSQHPTGSTYEWINPLNEMPRFVTMDELHATPNVGSVPSATRSLTEHPQAEPRHTEATPKQPQAHPSIACVEQQLLIDRCIAKNLPTRAGQRNQCLFRFARSLREFLPRDIPFVDLLVVVKKWHACALPFIRTKEIAETITDFVVAWKSVRWPKGTGWRRIVEEAERDAFTLGDELTAFDPAARLLRALARDNSGGPFPLSSRKLAEVFGVNCPKTALSRMIVFETMGYLEMVKKGEAKPGGDATLWRWIGPME